MNLRQQIVEQRTEELAKQLNISQDDAFMRLSHSLFTNQSVYGFQPSDLVDGGGDKQVDLITIEPLGNQTNLFIIQSKNTNGFSSTNLIQLKNGLDWIFKKKKGDLAGLENESFREKILEYRSVQSDVGPSNINVIVGFVTKGDKAKGLSNEFAQEAKTIVDEYDNGTFASFSFDAWGADELINEVNRIERSEKKINVDIPIRYDANNPSLIKYHSGELKGLVCSVSAYEIAKIVNQDPEGHVFDSNIRKYKGTRGSVNNDIYKTCTSQSDSSDFWFLNNGITIVCDSFDPVTDPDQPRVKINNIQIVNGCQTASTLALAELNGELVRDVRVLVKIYEASDHSLIDRIVLTTNNQNRISARDLRANESIQLDMERGFRKYSYFYERKPFQYRASQAVDSNRVFANEVVAQSFLAIGLKKMSDASRRKYRIWDDYYEQIFSGKNSIEPYIISALVHRKVAEYLFGRPKRGNKLERKLVSIGTFHIARITSFLWRGSDSWKISEAKLADQIKQLEADQDVLNVHIENGIDILKKIFTETGRYKADPDVAIKSIALDEEIDSHLYTNKLH